MLTESECFRYVFNSCTIFLSLSILTLISDQLLKDQQIVLQVLQVGRQLLRVG